MPNYNSLHSFNPFTLTISADTVLYSGRPFYYSDPRRGSNGAEFIFSIYPTFSASTQRVNPTSLRDNWDDSINYQFTIDWGDGFKVNIDNNTLTGTTWVPGRNNPIVQLHQNFLSGNPATPLFASVTSSTHTYVSWEFFSEPDFYHLYPSAGTYTIKIYGIFDRFKSYLQGSATPSRPLFVSRYKNISKWGDVVWRSFKDSFRNFTQSLSGVSVDTPRLDRVRTMYRAFSHDNATGESQRPITDSNWRVSNWDFSRVTDMSYMFENKIGIGITMSGWNVSNVTNMEGMFFNTSAITKDINGWNVSNVRNMKNMFVSSSFNRPLSGWNVSNVVDMTSMFGVSGAFGSLPSKFNQNINNWNVSNVTGMSYMFQSATFNQPIGNWDVTKVTDMSNMFSDGTLFNQDIGNWNVSAVTNMQYMFLGGSLSTTNYNRLLTGWTGWIGGVPTKSVKSGVPIWVDSYYQSTGPQVDARAYLVSTLTGKSWTIVDSGPI
jgi:surface protein